MLGPGRMNLRPGLSYLLEDPRMKVSIPSFAFVCRPIPFLIKNERPQDARSRRDCETGIKIRAARSRQPEDSH